jgi:hypothetical protein
VRESAKFGTKKIGTDGAGLSEKIKGADAGTKFAPVATQPLATGLPD